MARPLRYPVSRYRPPRDSVARALAAMPGRRAAAGGSNPIFAGVTPLAYMVAGGLPAMQNVRRLLDARRAGR